MPGKYTPFTRRISSFWAETLNFLNNLRISTPNILKTVLNITVGTPNKGSSPHVFFLTLSSPRGGVKGAL